MQISKLSGFWNKLIAIAIAAACSVIAIDAEYDYVVVGGGISGLVLGNRLSESGLYTVLVIEAGPLDVKDDQILVPSNAPRQMFAGRYMFNTASVPQPGMNNRTGSVFAAKVVGGGSAINGMFLDRGAKIDYDAWERMGNPGWGWSGLLPYFVKSETFQPPNPQLAAEFNITWEPSAHGTNGPLRSGFPTLLYPSVKNFFRACASLGVQKTRDGGNGDAVGVFFIPNSVDTRNMTRSYARVSHYDPFANRTNYHLLPENQVTKLIFTRSRVTAVEYAPQRGAAVQRVGVRKEAILAAGAIHTPQVLQLSGIGPRALLTRLGIPVISDLPGVGANFQDHQSTRMTFTFSRDLIPNPSQMQNATYAQQQWQQYVQNRTGVHTISVGNSAAFISLPVSSPRYQALANAVLNQTPAQYLAPGTAPEVVAGYVAQKRLLAEMYRSPEAGVLELPFTGNAGAAIVHQKILSRGTILINSTDVFTEPIIDYRVLSNPIDLEVFVDMIKFSRRVFQTPDMTQLGPTELAPGPSVNTDDAFANYVRAGMSASIAHPCCTAAMQARAQGGVVDSQLRVYGVDNLRIVDASLWPLIPATHTQSSVYATAEKAADVIKQTVYADSGNT